MATLRTVTVKASGGDYTSLKSAIDGEASDITAATGSDEILRIDCYPFEDTTDVVTVGSPFFTTSPTEYVELRFVDNAGDPLYVSKWSTSAYRLVGTNSVFENNQMNHLWHTEGTFQIMDNGGTSTSTASVFKCNVNAPGGWMRMDGGGILIVDHNSGTNWRAIKIDRPMECRWRNWIVYGGTHEDPSFFSIGVDLPNGSGGPVLEFDNCTFDGFRVLYWIADATGTYTFRNCRATNISSSAITTAPNGNRLSSSSNYNITDTNAASIEVNWGANSIEADDSPTIDYVDDSNVTLTSRDYTLNSSSDSGYEAGQDLSGVFTTDIADVTRTTPWDMGALELSTSATAVLALYGWRFRDDDGIEATGGATFMQAEDTAITVGGGGDVALDTGFRCRIGIDETNTGDPAATVIQVKAKLNNGTAFDVTGASSIVQMIASSNFVDGAATTDHGLAAPAGTFLAGEILETDGSTTSLDLAQNQYTIVEFAVQVIDTDVVTDDIIEFGLSFDGVDYFLGVTMLTVTPSPDAPGSFTAGTPTGSTIPVTWTDPNSATALPKLWLSIDAGTNWDLVATLSATATSYTFTGLSAGTLYSVGASYFEDPIESILSEDTATTIGGDLEITTLTAAISLAGIAGDITTGSGPTRDPPTGGGGIRVIIRCG